MAFNLTTGEIFIRFAFHSPLTDVVPRSTKFHRVSPVLSRPYRVLRYVTCCSLMLPGITLCYLGLPIFSCGLHLTEYIDKNRENPDKSSIPTKIWYNQVNFCL